MADEKNEKKKDDGKKTQDEKRIREPFPPENTPEPPQIMDTSKEPGSRREKESSQSKKQEKPSGE
ncbi:MAG TPA: hypothetical protein VKZ68_03450 [Ohtaekwangia sp.]|nr:hypothetical protein [Ohtaekwangia sp.]